MKIEHAAPSQFQRLVTIRESSTRTTHHFLQESDIAALHLIHDFLGVNENPIEMLFVDDANRGKGVGKFLLTYTIEHLGANKVDVNEQNPQGVDFYSHIGLSRLIA